MSTRPDFDKGWEEGVAAARRAIEAGALAVIEGWLAPVPTDGLINSPRRRAEPSVHRIAAALLAKEIGGLTAGAALSAPFVFSREFRAAVRRDANSGWALCQARKRGAARTDPLLPVVREKLNTPTKLLVPEMLRRGLIEHVEGGYRIWATGAVVKESTMKSKLSRLRKKVHNT